MSTSAPACLSHEISGAANLIEVDIELLVGYTVIKEHVMVSHLIAGDLRYGKAQ